MSNNLDKKYVEDVTEMVKYLTKDFTKKEFDFINKFGLVEARKAINGIIYCAERDKLFSEIEKHLLTFYKEHIELKLKAEAKTRTNYSDSSEFLDSFVEPDSLQVIKYNINFIFETLATFLKNDKRLGGED